METKGNLLLRGKIMKRIFVTVSGLILLFGLSACSGSASASPSTQTANAGISLSTETQGLLPTDYDNALPVEMQLIVGTFKLEGTQNAVDAATAKELLPLWQAVQSLGSSDSTSAIEMDALYKQIQETMKPEQIAAIEEMKLTRQDIASVSQEMGLNFQGGGNSGNFTPEQRATAQANRQSGQAFNGGGNFPGGGPFGGGGPGGGGGSNSGQRPTPAPGQASQFRSNTVFLNAIIKLLQSKAG
jgi:hypothetical protein